MRGSLDRSRSPKPAQVMSSSASVSTRLPRLRSTVASAASLISAPRLFAGWVRCIAPRAVFQTLPGL
jgi:hypothetical protein